MEEMEENYFGWALDRLQEGRRVSRAGWNEKGQWLKLQVPDSHSANTLPYIWIHTVTGDRVPWAASHTDLLAMDWVEAGPAV